MAGAVVPHRTSYVCAPFAIDRFGALTSETAASVRNNGRIAAADAWRASVWSTFSSELALPPSARVPRLEGSTKEHATTLHMMNSRMFVMCRVVACSFVEPSRRGTRALGGRASSEENVDQTEALQASAAAIRPLLRTLAAVSEVNAPNLSIANGVHT